MFVVSLGRGWYPRKVEEAMVQTVGALGDSGLLGLECGKRRLVLIYQSVCWWFLAQKLVFRKLGRKNVFREKANLLAETKA